MRKSIAALVVFGLGAGSAAAHHSFSVFNMETEVSITGTVREVQWTNPHVWIFVDVPMEG
ncbi:MAG: DUF6152 family protein, partial [Gammaproteobacteria bacterium]